MKFRRIALSVILGIVYLSQIGVCADCSCKKIKFEVCQKDALYFNKEFIKQYTRDSVDSFSVNLYEDAIITPTREQTKIIKKRYRNMFKYPEPKEEKWVTEAPVVDPTPPPGNTGLGTFVERNNTCTNTTYKEIYEIWIKVTEQIQCNWTDSNGVFRHSRKRSISYHGREALSRRVRRQTSKIKLCNINTVPTERVLYTVTTNKGEPVQIAQVSGAYQDQGDLSCDPSPNIPSDITCVQEMVDSPKVVFRLRGKYIDSDIVRIPRCFAYKVV